MTTYTGTHDRFGANPDAVFQQYWVCDQIERGFFIIVIAGEQINALRNTYVIFDLHVGQVVDPDSFADPAMIAHPEPPGVFDIDARFYNCIPPYLCAEQAQQKDFYPGKRK